MNTAFAIDNTVYDNEQGITTTRSGGFNTISNNRIFNNNIGILEQSYDATISANQIYSNLTGIIVSAFRSGYTKAINNNLIYANRDQGINLEMQASFYTYDAIVDSNTIYQEVGDAILVQATNLQLRNNILHIGSGYAVNVADEAQSGFVSDYNLFSSGAANGYVGYWGGDQVSLADWQSATSGAANSLLTDPLFTDIDGADNVFGFQAETDGGLDDNFTLRANSPAIDRAYSWSATRTDFLGQTRFDDNGSSNLGSPDYSETLISSEFAENGTGQGWRSGNTYWELDLAANGMSFPFYGVDYDSLYVSSEGFLQFGTTTGVFDQNNSADSLIHSAPRIAPLWDNLYTFGADNDIFVDWSQPDQVTIRWNANSNFDDSNVNFSATLYQSGEIQFDYGSGNANLTPTVGISAGDGRNYVISILDESTNLAMSDSVRFNLLPGFVDIGAFEFAGSSNDVTAPVVTGTQPAGIDAATTVSSIDSLELLFSEPMNRIDANAAANYQLVSAGPNGQFGDSDDVILTMVPNYSVNEFSVTLDIIGGRLTVGTYRLTVSAGDELRDVSGLALDGDGDGTEGGAYARTFQVVQGDFNDDGAFDITDLDALVNNVADNSGNVQFDLNGDGVVNYDDVLTWLAIAGAVNLPSGNPYLPGDGNLDGVVDTSDFNIWNANKFTVRNDWSTGDYNADGVIDTSDFNIWNG
ncbi:MAG: Ig-like domain-containing protein, partial [Planctomycetota bacterium]